MATRHFFYINTCLTSFGGCGRGLGSPDNLLPFVLNIQYGKVDCNNVMVCKMTIHPVRRIFVLGASCGDNFLRRFSGVGEYLPTKGSIPGRICKHSRNTDIAWSCESGRGIVHLPTVAIYNTMTCLTFIFLSSLHVLCYAATSRIYIDKWAVHIEGGESVARRLAETHGFTYLHEVRRGRCYNIHRDKGTSKRVICKRCYTSHQA